MFIFAIVELCFLLLLIWLAVNLIVGLSRKFTKGQGFWALADYIAAKKKGNGENTENTKNNEE